MKNAAGLEIPAPDPESWPYLRFAAGIFYAQDLNDGSLAMLHKHPQFAFIPYKTLQEWCQKDGWVSKRKEHKDMVRNRIAAQVGDKLAQARIKQLETLGKLYDLGVQKIESKIVDANSWEGVVNALTKLAALMDDYRIKISEQVVPFSSPARGEGSGPVSPIKPRLSEEEAQEAASLIIRRRREEMRRELAASEPESKALTVVKGGNSQ